MTVKSVLKKVLLTILIINVVWFLALCSIILIAGLTGKETSAPKVTYASREDVFKNVVQSTANKYGILNQEEASSDSDIMVNGLWEAKAFDITGDDDDELFLVYVDDNVIKMEIYEYRKGNAVKKWNQDAGWGSIYHLNVQRSDKADKVYWEYGETRGYTHDVYSFEDGLYKSANSLYDGVTEKEWEKYGGEFTTRWEEGDIYRNILKSRFGIFTSYDEETRLVFLGSEFGIGTANKDELVKRWNIKIPEPKISPSEALEGIVYYGDKNICRMPKEMALAYIDAIESDKKLLNKAHSSAKLHTILMDIANDGMPLLITAITEAEHGMEEIAYIDDDSAFYIWTWNGEKAKKYNILSDTESNFTFGFDFWITDSNEKLVVHDGLSLDVGGASGYVTYDVSNAMLTKINHRMVYSAYQESADSDKIYGRILKGAKTWTDENGREYTTESEILKAGWTCMNPDRADGHAANYNAEYVNGKLVKHDENYDFYDLDAYYDRYGDGYTVMYPSTGPWTLEGEWSDYESSKKALELYSKVAGRPIYSYEDVTMLFTDEQIEEIIKITSKKIKGEIKEIYKLNDNLYLVIIYADGDVKGSAVIKNTKNGTAWRVVASDTKAMTEDAVSKEINEDSKTVNIKLDIKKAHEGTVYLKKVLGDVDGVTPNSSAKNEIIKYIETSVSQNSKVSVKAKKNVISLGRKDLEKAIENANNTNDEYSALLEEYGVSLDKPVGVIIYVIVENIDSGKAIQVIFDDETADMLSEDNEIMLVLGDSKCTVKVSKKALNDILDSYGRLNVTIQRKTDDTYTIQYADENGKMIEVLDSSLTFTLPANDTLATIWAEYTGGAGNWGGQLDTAGGTISFDTPYSGTYTVMSEKVDIKDIEGLSDEHKKAIEYMVSKGYFILEDGNFNPDTPLRRYDFSEAIVGMFFADDPSAESTFADVSKDDPYYRIVASGEKLNVIEGYAEDNTFRGTNNMTREEALALCSRTLINHKKYTRPEMPFDYLHFTDNKDISDWAEGEIALTVREALIEDGGMLYPQSEISRADGALLLYKLFMLLHEVEPVSVITSTSPINGNTVLWIILAAIVLLLVIIIILTVILIKKKKQDIEESNKEVITKTE